MRCKFSHARYKGPDGFCVFLYHTQDLQVPVEARRHSRYGTDWALITAVGYGLTDTSSVDVELEGTWQNSKYGMQLNVTSCREVLPNTAAGAIAYLSSGLIKGIGPETAKAIVARFGTNAIAVLDSEPEKLLEVKGIAKAKLEKILVSYRATRKLRDLTEYLAPFGVSVKKIAKIQEVFGDDSLAIVRRDPFQLCRIRGFGFLTVDEIARKTKVSLKNPLRFAGAIEFLLDEAKGAGHLFLPLESLSERCYDLLNRDCEQEVVSLNDVAAALQTAHQEKRIYNENGRVYPYFERHCEVQTAKRLVSMLLYGEAPPIHDLRNEIEASERALHQQLADSQRRAVELCLTQPVSIITGGPGVGKTTTLRVILDIYHRTQPDNEKYFSAP